MKYKSIQISLKANQRIYGNTNPKITTVKIQRNEKGFYYSYSSRGTSNIHYMNLNHYLDKNDNLFTKDEYKDDHGKDSFYLLVQLKDLLKPENSKRIFLEKVDIYFKFLREIMAYRPKFLCYLREISRNEITLREFKVNKLFFIANALSLDINLRTTQRNSYNEQHDFKYEKTSNDLIHMLDYSNNRSRKYDEEMQEQLILFINNYQAISKKLDEEEALKKKTCDTCKSFLQQMKVHTLPFKVLNELKK